MKLFIRESTKYIISQNILNLHTLTKTKVMVKKTTWQDYLKLAPIVYAFLVALSYLKEFLYFYVWKINIGSYLDLSEILTSFLDDFILFLLLILFSTVFFFPIAVIYYLKKNMNSESIWMNSKKGRLKIQIIYTIGVNILTLIMLFVLRLYDRLPIDLNFEIYIPIQSFILFFVFYPVLINKTLPIKRTILLIILSLIYSTVYFSLTSAYKSQNRKNIQLEIVEVGFEKDTISRNGQHYFIRMTNSYIFYNDSTHAIAYPIKDVVYIKNAYSVKKRNQ